MILHPAHIVLPVEDSTHDVAFGYGIGPRTGSLSGEDARQR